MLKAVLFVNGYPLSGKDSFADALKVICREKDVHVLKISTVDLPKKALMVLGWDGVTKDEAARAMLHEMKMSWSKHMDGSFQYVQRALNIADGMESDCIVLVDSREPAELARFKEAFGGPLFMQWTPSMGGKPGFNAKTLFVQRENSGRANNDADMNVENFTYDIVVTNRDFPETADANAWVAHLEDEARRVLLAIL